MENLFFTVQNMRREMAVLFTTPSPHEAKPRQHGQKGKPLPQGQAPPVHDMQRHLHTHYFIQGECAFNFLFFCQIFF